MRIIRSTCRLVHGWLVLIMPPFLWELHAQTLESNTSNFALRLNNRCHLVLYEGT